MAEKNNSNIESEENPELHNANFKIENDKGLLFKDLDSLKETELREFSYSETYKVLKALSKIQLTHCQSVETIEKVETYWAFTKIIEEKVNIGDFAELEQNEDKKEDFFWKLYNLKYNFSNVLIISNALNATLQETREYFYEVNFQKEDIEDIFDNTIKELSKVETDTQERLNQWEKRNLKKIENVEHTTITHVLSIMGIFSAIITIILSLITTSSSWINNSTEADMFFAFIVPNGVAILAVFALMILVYYFVNYHKNDESDGDKEKQNNKIEDKKEVQKRKEKHKPIYIMLSVVVLISALLLLSYIATQNIKTPIHVRYIIPSTEYEVIEDTEVSAHKCPHNTECNCQSVKETKNYFEFTFEDKLYRFEYNESYLHDGNLYFCEKHCTLE